MAETNEQMMTANLLRLSKATDALMRIQQALLPGSTYIASPEMLEARIAKFKADEARLDYISEHWFHHNQFGRIEFNPTDQWDAGLNETLRDAIDAAIRS